LPTLIALAVDQLYNVVFLIDADGEILGCHRKINTHAESWASPGEVMEPASCHGLKAVVLLWADAYTPVIAQTLKSKGAQLLVSSAAWAPGLYGPEGEWEQRTLETGLPLIVCNRTGKERTLAFDGAESLVIKNGRRLLSYSSRRSAVLTFDWDLKIWHPAPGNSRPLIFRRCCQQRNPMTLILTAVP
jgi:N-carbamoylputrescine amidase